MSEDLRAHWWAAVASVARMVGGDLGVAEDAVQEACVAAVDRWPVEGVPADRRAWLVGTARHKALDALRRESRRQLKEAHAVRELGTPGPPEPGPYLDDPQDRLALVLMCCHPALALDVRVALTLRAVCGLGTAEIAAMLLVSEPTLAKRLVRARRKIRDTGLSLALPAPGARRERVAAVLKVVYLLFTEGHRGGPGPAVVLDELCATAIGLARELCALLPGDAEAQGLLALLLLADARRPARTDPAGELVLLAEQDRSRYDRALIEEGERLLERALRTGPPGPYQIQAAVAACHSTAPTAADTDWRQIALLYAELLRHEPSPVHEANRAVAVAMAEGPAAGLVVLDALAHHPQLARWPALQLARADLLRRLDRRADAVAAYRAALELDPPAAERRFAARRIAELTAAQDGPGR